MQISGFAKLLRLLGAKKGDWLELRPAGRTPAGRLVANVQLLGAEGSSVESSEDEEGSGEEGFTREEDQGGEAGAGPSAQAPQAAAAPRHHHDAGGEEEDEEDEAEQEDEGVLDGSWLAYDSLRRTRGMQPRDNPRGAQRYQAMGSFRVQVLVKPPGDPDWREGNQTASTIAIFRDQPSCWRAYDVANLWRGVHRMCGRSLDQVRPLSGEPKP